MSETTLSLRSVGKRFGGVHAVQPVSLELHQGERLAVLGPNGAGKSTLFNVIAGDVPPSQGTITLFGKDVTREPLRRRVRRGLARTYQTSSLFAGLTVNEHLMMAATGMFRWRMSPRRHTGATGPLRESAALAAEHVGLSARWDDPASGLSHGEQRQLEVAMALVTSPHLVLLDEPAAGLSAKERVTLVSLLQSIPRSCSVLLIEHDMDVALTCVDRVMVMENGQVVAEGTPAAIEEDPVVRAVYLGAQGGRSHKGVGGHTDHAREGETHGDHV
jgi:branched-chain amino acid transport system ATP-binding protein